MHNTEKMREEMIAAARMENPEFASALEAIAMRGGILALYATINDTKSRFDKIMGYGDNLENCNKCGRRRTK